MSHRRSIGCAAALMVGALFARSEMVVGPWTPIFQGVDHAAGTNYPDAFIPRQQVVHCVRVDLTDPGVQLFTTPPAPNPVSNSRETLSLSINSFVRNYGVQVASDCNFYRVFPGNSDPSSEGLPGDVEGMLVCTGRVVSAADNTRFASLLFTTNKAPTFQLINTPPGASLTGIYTAVTGYYPVLTNGLNVWDLYYADLYNRYTPNDSNIHIPQPRTSFGISQDKRYLFLVTIDGRQSGYSDGALDTETAQWMLQFGAWDAINMDGGGSTSIYMADCAGNPVRLNHSSYLAAYGRERILGDHFGVRAQPLPGFIHNVSVLPADTTATITWTTDAPADSQVDYGLTTAYGAISPKDPALVTSHNVTLSGLAPGKHYFYRLHSFDGVTDHTWACGGPFGTTNGLLIATIFDLTKTWKYSTANLDGVSWQSPSYNDAGWTGSGSGVLWVDSNNPGIGSSTIGFLPLNTEMPLDPNTTYPFITYYFRTRFTYTNNPVGAILTFSNYVDDGAVFYLNGVEIDRLLLPTPASSATTATSYFCPDTGDATCPYVFTVSGSMTTNLVVGTNVLAVEVHNVAAHSPDVTFGQVLTFSAPAPLPPPPPFLTNVTAIPGETSATINWTTLSNSTSRLRYGLTLGMINITPLDPTLVTNHSITITNLLPLTNYYFRVASTIGATQYLADGTFSTVPFYAGLISISNIWAYNTNNLDGTGWQNLSLDESTWLGDGPGLLYLETNAAVAPRNTLLPATPQGMPAPTYYFRTHFVFDTNTAGFALLFSNYVDDGAVFYLNGTEIQRLRMAAAPQAVHYLDQATACAPGNCSAVTNAPDLFRLGGDWLTNLVSGGDNVLAVEVHQVATTSPNVVFGSALGVVRALASETRLAIGSSSDGPTISWDGAGLTLQWTASLGNSNGWSDVPGPIKAGPYAVTNPPATTFYRLRN